MPGFYWFSANDMDNDNQWSYLDGSSVKYWPNYWNEQFLTVTDKKCSVGYYYHNHIKTDCNNLHYVMCEDRKDGNE